MTESEGRALARTAAVLLLASLARWGMAVRRGPPLLPADSASALPALLEASREQQEEAERRRRPLADGEKLDPNVVSAVELDRLPGVGPATADALVEAREQMGGFRAPEDLLDVRGIGPATLRKIFPYLDFSRPPPLLRPLAGPQAISLTSAGARASPGEAALDFTAQAIDVNSAGPEELEDLPGVGPALARRIMEERERKGGFASVEDLLSVRGIGPATLERLRARVVVR